MSLSATNSCDDGAICSLMTESHHAARGCRHGVSEGLISAYRRQSCCPLQPHQFLCVMSSGQDIQPVMHPSSQVHGRLYRLC